MDANLITRIDIESIYPTTPKDQAGLRYIITTIHPKVLAAFPPGSQTSFLECSNYDTVYITSDIHSDLRKFMQILMSLKLIPTKSIADIYDPTLISDVIWTGGANTLFIIVGDLVDGKRNEERSVDDPKGSFELLLFLLLHNLRIQARKVKSDIRYTMGNHELDSCINDTIGFYDDYVTDDAKRFFINFTIRRQMLRPFLQASPSILLALADGDKNELICIHGGLHEDDDTGERGKDLTDSLKEKQETLDSTMDLITFVNILVSDNKTNGAVSRGAWTRLYKEDTPDVCGTLERSAYPLTVVGHCPTLMSERPIRIFTENPAYSHCDKGDDDHHVGCIITDCNKDGAPTLAMVDAGMSAGFRRYDPKKNPSREVEVLKLTHDRALESAARYYNTIEATTGKETRLMYKAGLKEFNNDEEEAFRASTGRFAPPPLPNSPAVYTNFHPTPDPKKSKPSIPRPSYPAPKPLPTYSLASNASTSPSTNRSLKRLIANEKVGKKEGKVFPFEYRSPSEIESSKRNINARTTFAPMGIRRIPKLPKTPNAPPLRSVPLSVSSKSPSNSPVSPNIPSKSPTIPSNSVNEDPGESFNDPPVVAVGGKRRTNRRRKHSKRTRKAKKRN